MSAPDGPSRGIGARRAGRTGGCTSHAMVPDAPHVDARGRPAFSPVIGGVLGATTGDHVLGGQQLDVAGDPAAGTRLPLAPDGLPDAATPPVVAPGPGPPDVPGSAAEGLPVNDGAREGPSRPHDAGPGVGLAGDPCRVDGRDTAVVWRRSLPASGGSPPP